MYRAKQRTLEPRKNDAGITTASAN